MIGNIVEFNYRIIWKIKRLLCHAINQMSVMNRWCIYSLFNGVDIEFQIMEMLKTFQFMQFLEFLLNEKGIILPHKSHSTNFLRTTIKSNKTTA